MKKIDPRFKKVLFTEKQIDEGIKKLANWLNKKFKGNCPVLFGILNGVYPFYAKLAYYLTFDHENCFAKCESYIDNKKNPDIKVWWYKKSGLAGKDIILVDELFDTCTTITTVIKELKKLKVKSITTVGLLDKPSKHRVNFKPDYVCFKAPNDFLIGFSLDFNGIMRNIPYIGIPKDELIK